jgi:NADPH:quinone reductase-like Zn-dependent oxidoreductase
MDAAGVLEQIGEGVSTDLRVGDHVMAIVVPDGLHGAYSERVVVPAESVVKTPAGATDVEASTLPMNGLTARLALDLLSLRSGQTVAVTGAAGAVGGYVVQLAKADNLRVIADASPSDENLVRSLGANVVVARGPNVSERIREAMPEGVDGLVDAALMNEHAVPAVRVVVAWPHCEGSWATPCGESLSIRCQCG